MVESGYEVLERTVDDVIYDAGNQLGCNHNELKPLITKLKKEMVTNESRLREMPDDLLQMWGMSGILI